ncbi:MAG: homoserine dehydrogenase [Clostridium sp.]|nr:homoserine dehydrogenase [Clostridium sp.]MCM1547811.1 homoserine dehydrogenase [Ruminococcus sp.]
MSKFAVLGYGVVGSGVVELFYKNREKIEKRAGEEMDVKYILDIREFPDSPYKDKFVKTIDEIAEDPEIKAVAECMGGVEPAFTFSKKCLENGISVSTSNKELVAAKGDILLKLAKENNCNYFFEASVGGAIPIIRPLHKCLAANSIDSVSGILNGTTNFILTKMINEGMKFDDALKLAQELGYAEKDPTADVEGHDACRKICIISSLVYGKHVYPESVYTKGISDIKLEDVQIVSKWGGSIKLIARVTELESGKILPIVMPMIVPFDNLMSRVDDVFNAVLVSGNGIDKTMFYGRGAGKLPTASAVMGDVIDSVKHDRTVFSQSWESVSDNSFVEDHKNYRAPVYFRAEGAESVCPDDCEKIASPDGQVCFMTKEITLAEADLLKDKLEASGAKVISMIPVLKS